MAKNRVQVRRRMGVAAIALAAVASLVGCSGASPDDGPDDGPARDSMTAGTPFIPESLTPFLNNFSSPVFEFLYSPLVEMSPSNEVVGALADSWEVSDDAATVTFHLQEGQHWSDGSPITSTDALWSLTQYLDPRVSPTWASIISGVEGLEEYTGGATETVSGLSAPDDLTLVVELAASNASWLNILAVWGPSLPILPSAQFEGVPSEELQEHDFFDTFPVVSGPYLFESWEPGQSVEFERNPEWSGGEARLTHISYVVRDQSTAVAQIQTGELDYFLGTLPPADITRLEGMEGMVVASSERGTSPDALGFNLDEGQPIASASADFRRGVLHAIDREGICTGVLEGRCTVPLTNVRQVAPEWAIPTEGVTEYGYDPDLARELIDRSGFDTSQQITILQPGEPKPWQDAVAANLTDVGLNVVVQHVEPSVFTELVGGNRESWQMYFGGGGAFIADPHQEATYSRCSAFYPNGSNQAHQCIEAIEPLWDEGIATSDEGQRAEIYHEIFRELSNDPARALLFVEPRVVVHSESLNGVEVRPFAEHAFWHVGIWSFE